MIQEEQKKILIGTKNPAKFERYKTIIRRISLAEILSLNDIQLIEQVHEDGSTVEENARKKALVYATSSCLPTLSIDEGLIIGGLTSDEQPGTNVRRYLGWEATDEELLRFYLDKIKTIAPHERTAKWIFALCLAFPDGTIFFDQAELHGIFIDRPSLPILPGYPLSSIIFDPTIGKTLRDLTPEEEFYRLSPIYEKVRAIILAAGLLQGPTNLY